MTLDAQLTARCTDAYETFAFCFADSAYFDGEDPDMGRQFIKDEAESMIVSAVASGFTLADMDTDAQAAIAARVAANVAAIEEANALTPDQKSLLGIEDPDMTVPIGFNGHVATIDWPAVRAEIEVALAV